MKSLAASSLLFPSLGAISGCFCLLEELGSLAALAHSEVSAGAFYLRWFPKMPESVQDDERIWVALAMSLHDDRPRRFRRLRNLGLLQIVVVCALFAFLVAVPIVLVHDSRTVQINAFVVPKIFDDRGFTSQTIDNRVVDEITRIQRVVDEIGKNDRAAKTDRDTEQFELATAELPDIEIEVPPTRFSFGALIQILQEWLNLQPPRISGEITTVTSSKSGDENLLITIRAMRNSDRQAPVQFVVTSVDPEATISTLAQQVIRMINPFILGVYAYSVERDRQKAVDLWQEAIKLDPRNVDAYIFWGWVLVRDHDYDAAIAKFKSAIEVNPRSYKSHVDLGNTLFIKGDTRDAKREFEKAVELEPRIAGNHINLGAILNYEHDYPAAIAQFRKAIALDPNYLPAYLDLGNAFQAEHHPDDAITQYQKAATLDPKLVANYLNWGNALVDKRDFDGAIAKYQKAVALDPNFAPAYNGWGNGLYLKHDLDGAIAMYSKAIHLDPGNRVFRQNLEVAQRSR